MNLAHLLKYKEKKIKRLFENSSTTFSVIYSVVWMFRPGVTVLGWEWGIRSSQGYVCSVSGNGVRLGMGC